MSYLPTYLTLTLLVGACTFNTENNLSGDGGPVLRDDAGNLIDDASQTDAVIVDKDGAPDADPAPDGPVSPPVTCDSTNSDLLLCLTFDGVNPNSPMTVPDESGNNYVATFNNGAIAASNDGMGLQTETSFESSIASAPALAGAKTIEMWVQPTTLGRLFQGLFEGEGYYFYIYSTGRLGCASTAMGDNPVPLTTSQEPVITANQWQHVACVMDASGAKLFVNGIEIIDRVPRLDSFTDSPLYTFGRGSSSFSGVRLFGMIDTLRVWSTDRSGQICPQCVVPPALLP